MLTTLSSTLSLQHNCIDLWFIDPNQLSTQQIYLLTSFITKDEKHKLQQYKNKSAQHIALITRAVCRLVLSQYTNTEPTSLEFIRDQHGKPELLNNPLNFRFNLSHNNNLIIMAVTVIDDIGCDIEDPKRKINIEAISRRYFAKQEYQALHLLKNEKQQTLFFQFWTLKEAFVKATGLGISLGLDSFYFCFNNDQQQNIDIYFNANYSLTTNDNWYFYQNTLNQQMLSICRKSKIQQDVNYFDIKSLLGN